MPYGYMNQLPPSKRHTPKWQKQQKKRKYAKRAGLVAGAIGFLVASTSGFINGVVCGVLWFYIIYLATRFFQNDKTAE